METINLSPPTVKAAASAKEDLQFKITVAGGVFLLVFVAGYLLQAAPPHDKYGYLIGRDFVNTWMGARAALSGHIDQLFHLQVYMQHLVATFGPMVPHNWSYPPSLLLFIWPLGFLPYIAACALWSVTGMAAYVGSAAAVDRSWRYLAFVAVTPAIGINLFCGQNGFFTAALLILVFRYWDERPIVAGLILGAMLYKPHLVVLFPLALALSGRWRVIAAAGVSALTLAGLTALIFGHDIWSEYFRLVVPVQQAVMRYGTGFLTMMPTGFMQARMLGAGYWLAWLVQIPFTLLALAALVWTFVKRRDPVLSYAVLITASFVVTPYAFDYDMVVFGWLVAMLWTRFEAPWDRRLLLAVWTLPVAMLFYGEWYVPLAAPLMALFLLRLVSLLRGEKIELPAAQTA
ncbi:MAG: glycosyltransferase family 87 protein [Rhizomicrobium sp.]|nr:glycosyltransferase family 87 protein [Rhizomicrobium sp.]